MVVKKNINLVWLPLEKLDKRYTNQTRRWYKREFSNVFNLKIVEGEELTKKIESGSFLDAYGTNYYKYTQLAKISKMFREGKIKNGDIFFIDDLWMAGIEGLRYMEKMGKNLKIRIYGVMHAGSWTPSDDVATKLGKQKWCKEYERSIFEMVDGVFVGSKFHKGQIEEYFGTKFDNKITVTGLPFYPSEILKSTHVPTWNKKSNIVIFPHRLHKEKHPELFDKMVKKWKKKYPDWKFIKTMELNLGKKQYLNLLAKSKIMVSYAEQENFGFATLEASTLGCKLVIPNRVVYPEFYPKECLYDNYNECNSMVLDNIQFGKLENYIKIPFQFENSIKKMIKVMKNDRRR